MDSIELHGKLSFRVQPNGRIVASLTLGTTDKQAIDTLNALAFGKLETVDALRYCHENTVFPHTVGGDGEGGYEIIMTINHNPWTGENIPSQPSR